MNLRAKEQTEWIEQSYQKRTSRQRVNNLIEQAILAAPGERWN